MELKTSIPSLVVRQLETWLLSKSAAAVRREFQRGLVEAPTLTDMRCVRVLIPADPTTGKVGGN